MISKSQIKLINALHLKKHRDEQKQFIAEGIKIVSEILTENTGLIKELFITPSFSETHLREIEKHKIPYTKVSEDELKKISTQSTPNQVLAVCNFLKNDKINIDLNSQFSIYLDDIRDPGNLGTILRIADWFGIKEMFCSPQSTELYNPKTIQAAMGAFLRVKLHYIALSEFIKQNPLKVYGAVLNGKSVYKEQLQHGLIVIGNEANGINKNNLSLINHAITIPASNNNKTESLNAAMATAIICGEFFRQLKQV